MKGSWNEIFIWNKALSNGCDSKMVTLKNFFCKSVIILKNIAFDGAWKLDYKKIKINELNVFDSAQILNSNP